MYQKSIIRFTFFSLLLFSIVTCHKKNKLNSTFWNQITDHQKVLKTWTKISQKNFDLDILTSGLSSKLDTLLVYTPNVTAKCAQSLRTLKTDGEKMKLWAIKALESWGRFPPVGLFSGTFSSLGDYDACLQNDGLQYCSVHLRPTLPLRRPLENINNNIELLSRFMNDKDKAISKLAEEAHFLYYSAMRIGLCLPTECSFNEIDRILQTVSSNLELNGKLLSCETNQIYKEKWDIFTILTMLSFVALILFALIGTIVDNYAKKNKLVKEPCIWLNIATSFSMKKNFNSLFRSDVNIKEFKCLNGLRVFTLIWIIFSHTYLWMNHYAFSNIFNIYKLLNNFPLSGFLNGFFAVDTFFVISGILSTFITFKSTKGSLKNFSLTLFAASRYLRLTPGVIFSMFGFFLLPFLGSGPFYTEIIAAEVENCRQHWFANLVYLQTNIPNEDSASICNIPTWWLSIEMKLHLMSIIIVVYFFINPKVSYLIVLVSTFLSFIWAAIDHLVHNYPPFTVGTIPEVEEFWEFTSDFLHRTHIHVGPFFIGLTVGYFLAVEKYSSISERAKFIGWFSAGSSILLLLWGPYPWVLGYRYSRWGSALYATTCQTIWALSISWIIFACVNGFGGVVNNILSSELFRPLARTIYMTYLTHGQVLILFSGSRNQLIPLETSNLAYIFIGHVFFCFIYGFILTLLVESPTLNLLKILIKKANHPQQPEDCNNNCKEKSNESNVSLKLEEI